MTPLKLMRTPHTLQFESHSFERQTLKVAFHRIHTIEGYAFAGSEHISMLVTNKKIEEKNHLKKLKMFKVINDNPIKIVDSFAFAGLKHVKFLLLSSSVKHLHVVNKQILRPQEYHCQHSVPIMFKSYSLNNEHIKNMMIRMHSTGWSQ